MHFKEKFITMKSKVHIKIPNLIKIVDLIEEA